ncbi:putative RNA polymerase II subunit A domain phosphatase [Trichinella spiralis]|uniref:putative RNA polymerase II subunit A domain phosphatase n=1 Tax=Trichinella spiralis TaxID=6334 RepID=UPI0001EFE552|nr:putative RNA polymerase II subunit A domain phosphatase [Trichinella spiralis]
MDELNANTSDEKKPEEEAGTSTEKKGKLNRLKKMWDGLIQHLCPRRTRNGVNSDSSSNDIPKLTVVFDLYFVAIRPHCREVLQAVREVANMMVYSAGTPKYVRHIVQLLDPEGKLFE